jgi:hypothetical protein
MAGANYVLDKGFVVLSTYNSSAAAGVTAYRCVAMNSSTGLIDLNATATALSIGVVQENIDAAKVATGKAVADVRVMGITKVRVSDTPGTIVLGSRLAPSGTGANAGGVKLAVTTNAVVGICVGPVPIGTPAAGDLIDMLLIPGGVAVLT